VALVTNWTIQAQKFFASKDLAVRVWSPEAWKADEGNQGTVWVVKESLLSQTTTPSARGPRKTPFWEIFSHPEFQQHNILLSTFADEGHLAWRSDSSTRSQVYKKITSLSKFNVILSGTMFPLGPAEDGRGILEHLGGDFTAHPENPPKWDDQYITACRRLFEINPQDKKDGVWDVLAFRVLISQFYLRRTIKSSWDGAWVISKAAARPFPRIVLPYPDAFTSLSNPRAQTKEVQQVRETLRTKMKRADHKRYMAWTKVYEMIHTDHGDAAFTGPSYHRLLENYLRRHLKKCKGSGRITKLIALVKAHVQNGEKFVIVSDRIFLVLLAYHVFPHFPLG
jgi:hypothetical protein